jgi:hypothetical protein
MTKKLLVVSNHPPEKWSPEQRAGWDEIQYIPFPNVPATATRKEVQKMADKLEREIDSIINLDPDDRTTWGIWKVSIQGESCLCAELIMKFAPEDIVFPTTERVSVEIDKGSGIIEKTVQFKFVRWR